MPRRGRGSRPKRGRGASERRGDAERVPETSRQEKAAVFRPSSSSSSLSSSSSSSSMSSSSPSSSSSSSSSASAGAVCRRESRNVVAVEKAPSVTRAMEEGEVREEEPPAKRARLVSEVPESAVAVERRMERGGREDIDASQASEGAWPAPSREERRRRASEGPRQDAGERLSRQVEVWGDRHREGAFLRPRREVDHHPLWVRPSEFRRHAPSSTERRPRRRGHRSRGRRGGAVGNLQGRGEWRGRDYSARLSARLNGAPAGRQWEAPHFLPTEGRRQPRQQRPQRQPETLQ